MRQFFLKGSKELVPYDKNLPVVFIHILLIDGMMHPVMRRSDNDFFEKAHFADMPGMIPKLCKQMQGSNYCNHCWRNYQ